MKHKAYRTLLILLASYLFVNSRPTSGAELLLEFPTEPRPNSIAVDDGYIYVANSHSHSQKVQKFNLTGELWGTIANYTANYTTDGDGLYSHYHPIDIALDLEHNLYVLVKPYRKLVSGTWFPLEGFCIMAYSSEGNFQREFDFANFEDEWRPAALAFRDGFLFVTNGRMIKRISIDSGQAYDILIREEDFTAPWGIHTTDMAVDAKGDFWLVGQAVFDERLIGCHIIKLNANGEKMQTFFSEGSIGVFSAELNNPGIAFDQEGNIYVATCYGEDVQKFDPEGNLLARMSMERQGVDYSKRPRPVGVAVDKYNRVYVVDYAHDLVCVFSGFDVPKGAVAGKVTDSSGRPIPGAQVGAWGPKEEGQEYSTIADSSGAYILSGLRAGAYVVWGGASGYLSGTETRHEGVSVSAQDTTQHIDLMLLVPASLSGVICGSDGRTGVGNVSVYLQHYDYPTAAGGHTGDNGAFVISGLWPGRAEICAVPPIETGYATTLDRLHISEGEVIEGYTLILERGALVSGHLTTATEKPPFQCVGVRARSATGLYRGGASAAVDDSGFYQLRLAPGRYTLAVDQGFLCSMFIPLAFSPYPCEVIISDLDQKVTQDFTVYFADWSVISGHVEDQTGQFDGKILVFRVGDRIDDPFIAWMIEVVGEGLIASDGSYRIHSPYLVPPTLYSLYAVTASQQGNLSVVSVWDKLEEVAPDRSDADFFLRSAGGNIKGKVEGGAADGDIIVLILDENKRFAGWVKAEYGPGTFEFCMDHLREGFHTAYALSSAHDEVPQCSFTVIEGETTEIPILAFGGTSVEEQSETASALTSYRLYANYPNPFNSRTILSYRLAVDSSIMLSVYNVAGQKVRTLVDGRGRAGSYRVIWDGKDDLGRDVSSGIYFYRLTVDGGKWTETKKMVLIR